MRTVALWKLLKEDLENFIWSSELEEAFDKITSYTTNGFIKVNIDDFNRMYFTITGLFKKDGSFNHLEDYMRPACNACDDFTNIYSDISFGGLGSPDKYTTVIPRTDKGKQLLQKILDENIVKSLELDDKAKNDMKELIVKFSESKIKRREEFMKNL